MSVRHETGAPMAERDGNMQPDVTVAFSNEMAFVLGFRKAHYWKVGECTSESVANVDTVNGIYIYCDVIEHRMVGHTLAPLIDVLPVTGNTGA